MRGRRRGSLLALTALLMSGGCRETTTDGSAMTVFVVRHAEYADDGSDNPGLSEIGFNVFGSTPEPRFRSGPATGRPASSGEMSMPSE